MKKRKGKLALVTGAAGFIGSHMCDELLKRKWQVVGIDNFKTGFKKNLPKHPNFRFYDMDVCEPYDLMVIFSENKFDLVLHIAGNASIVKASDGPNEDVATNLNGTIMVSLLCKKYQVPRLLYASSMTAYGLNTTKPEEGACYPISTYGITKFAAERFVINMQQDLECETKVTAFRMFNVYGPRQDLNNPYQGVAAIFMKKALNGEVITLFGDGKQTRDFVYISDVVRMWMMCIDNKKSFGEVFNVGTGKDISMISLINTISKVMFGKSIVTWQHEQERIGDQKKSRANANKAARFGWLPQVSLEQGLKKMYQWAKKEK